MERTIRQLVDDLDGSEITGIGERLEFSVRSVSYRIDLSATNVAKFDKALKPYVDAATKTHGTRGRRRRQSRAPTPKAPTSDESSPEQRAAIRSWARRNGFSVSDRGRLSAEVIEAFASAH